VTQTVNQVQAQQQQQQQQQAIFDRIRGLECFLHSSGQFQAGRASANSFQFGQGNVAANTPTNTNNQVGGL
jgi:hypothetical protein